MPAEFWHQLDLRWILFTHSCLTSSKRLECPVLEGPPLKKGTTVFPRAPCYCSGGRIMVHTQKVPPEILAGPSPAGVVRARASGTRVTHISNLSTNRDKESKLGLLNYFSVTSLQFHRYPEIKSTNLQNVRLLSLHHCG